MALSPTSSRGSGSAAVVTREELSGNGTSIAQNGFSWLTWNNGGSPNSLLDITTPFSHPVTRAAGVYMVSVIVDCVGAASQAFAVTLYLDRQGFNASESAKINMTSDATANSASIAFAWYIPENGLVEVGVDYFSGVPGAGSASIAYAHVQRLS